MSFDQVLKVDLVLAVNDLGTTVVSVCSLDLKKLTLDDFSDLLWVGKDSLKLRNSCVKLFKTVLNLLS